MEPGSRRDGGAGHHGLDRGDNGVFLLHYVCFFLFAKKSGIIIPEQREREREREREKDRERKSSHSHHANN